MVNGQSEEDCYLELSLCWNAVNKRVVLLEGRTTASLKFRLFKRQKLIPLRQLEVAHVFAMILSKIVAPATRTNHTCLFCQDVRPTKFGRTHLC